MSWGATVEAQSSMSLPNTAVKNAMIEVWAEYLYIISGVHLFWFFFKHEKQTFEN